MTVFPAPAALGDAPLTLTLLCDSPDEDLRAMETSYLVEGCWGHLGHHTYFVGRDRVWHLYGGSGRAFVTEQQLAPPAEGYGVVPEGPAVVTPVVLEVSIDGRSWQTIQWAHYTFLSLAEGTPSPQNAYFDFTADGVAFRYLRMREPLSATQGLSGYIDFSTLDLQVQPGEAVEAPELAAEEGRGYTCAHDILEDVWEAHPCTFGGHHWDAPSWFHTYGLGGEARLDRIAGVADLAYFRPDDPGTCCGQTEQGVLDGTMFVQTSLDGDAWDTVASVPVTYLVPVHFDVAGLGGKPAAFVRLVSAHHPGYFEDPALKHAEGYLLFSKLELSGLLPP